MPLCGVNLGKNPTVFQQKVCEISQISLNFAFNMSSFQNAKVDVSVF